MSVPKSRPSAKTLLATPLRSTALWENRLFGGAMEQAGGSVGPCAPVTGGVERVPNAPFPQEVETSEGS